MSEDYKRGYREGYQDGLKDGVNMPAHRHFAPPWPRLNETKCGVCGMIFEPGKLYGYVCGNSNCPTKVTSNTSKAVESSYLSSLKELDTGVGISPDFKTARNMGDAG